jgi:hypothetical protein
MVPEVQGDRRVFGHRQGQVLWAPTDFNLHSPSAPNRCRS